MRQFFNFPKIGMKIAISHVMAIGESYVLVSHSSLKTEVYQHKPSYEMRCPKYSTKFKWLNVGALEELHNQRVSVSVYLERELPKRYGLIAREKKAARKRKMMEAYKKMFEREKQIQEDREKWISEGVATPGVEVGG